MSTENQVTEKKFTVREVGIREPKSASEREDDVIKENEAKEELRKAEAEATAAAEKGSEQKIELDDDSVLGYLRTKLNKEISSFDELLQEKIVEKQLPEDVSKYAKYKEETGRGLEDFIKFQRDVDTIPDNVLLKEYLQTTEEGLDEEDINNIIETEYSFDEDLDDEKEIQSAKRKLKKTLAEAKKYFSEQKEQYGAPLESKVASVPDAELQEFNAYRERLKAAQSEQEVVQKQSQFFSQKTEELFSPEFKGFKFKVNEKEVMVPFGDPNELKVQQSDPRNFVNKYLDRETGLIKDPEGYHRALAAAMNPEKLASFFYELGKAEAIEAKDKSMKNINMSTRTTPQAVRGKGFTVREAPDKS